MKRKSFIRCRVRRKYQFLSATISLDDKKKLHSRLEDILESNNAELISIGQERDKKNCRYIYTVYMRKKMNRSQWLKKGVPEPPKPKLTDAQIHRIIEYLVNTRVFGSYDLTDTDITVDCK